MSNEEFLQVWNSADMDYDRKQVQLRIERILIPSMTEAQKYESRLQGKIMSRKGKISEENAREKLKVQKLVNENELKTSQKLAKALERYKAKHAKIEEFLEGRINEGVNLLAKIKREGKEGKNEKERDKEEK